jgi:hypothetical protein
MEWWIIGGLTAVLLILIAIYRRSLRENRNLANYVLLRGALGKEDAEDLLDFTVALLERMFTEPERLKLAELRRQERRKPSG